MHVSSHAAAPPAVLRAALRLPFHSFRRPVPIVNPSFARVLLATLLLTLAACGPRPAPDIGGRWKAVNRFAEQTEEIPLRPAYVYQAAPMDRTLKTMLERWARDSKMALSWELPSDYTLHAPVADVRAASIEAAAVDLTRIYAPQQVQVSVEGNRLVVRRATTAG